MVPVEYLAGFVDGEGYLGLARIRRRHRSTEYCLRLSIYNTDRMILEEIKRTTGGTMSVVGQRRPSWKPSYALIWTNAAAAQVIRKIKPFLLVKSEQGKALLAFDQRIRAGRRVRDTAGRLLPLDRQEVRFRHAIYNRVKRMNRRGSEGQRNFPTKAVSRGQPKVSARYVAGFIDAEGSLMITRTTVADCRTPQYHPRVTAANTQRDVLEAIQNRFGGIIANQPARNAAWKDAYQLVWTDAMIEPLLMRVQPHLRVKAKQARILNEFIRHRQRTKQGRNGRGFATLPPEVVRFRERLRREIRALNRRGSSGSVLGSPEGPLNP